MKFLEIYHLYEKICKNVSWDNSSWIYHLTTMYIWNKNCHGVLIILNITTNYGLIRRMDIWIRNGYLFSKFQYHALQNKSNLAWHKWKNIERFLFSICDKRRKLVTKNTWNCIVDWHQKCMQGEWTN